jgi:hypothetical protein
MNGSVPVLSKECPFCREVSTVLVVPSEYTAWQAGEFIQTAMPSLSADERELLISGVDSDCWDEYMRDPDEKDDEENDTVTSTDPRGRTDW